MHLRSLELIGFRNYTRATVSFGPGAHLLVGANGQGKTNLIEAVHYLAVGRSHRVSDDHALVRAGADEALLRAEVVDDGGGQHRVELVLRPGGRSRARIDGAERPRMSEAIGHLRAVLFAPEDVALVRGDPAERRRFLDDLLGQRRPAYRAARQDYERVLRQRNVLLKQLRAGVGSPASLDTWSDELVRLGARLMAARLMACASLAGPLGARYAELAGSAGPAAPLTLTYRASTGAEVPADEIEDPDPAWWSEQLRTAVEHRADAERERGASLVGPHRDDLHLELDGLPAKTHASQGEAWSVALALRLASRELLREVGHDPVLLLDDVFAELDAARRERLARWCETCEQVLMTAAVPEDVPLAARQLRVVDGAVVVDTASGAA